MRLLIVTQKVDAKDPILGFFIRWIEEFAMRCETVTVIGQFVHGHSLPANVRVLSMGKERRLPRVMQVWMFWKHILAESSTYDAVLVHMTPIWVILGTPVWRIFRKPIYLWYEARGTWPLRHALCFARKVFSASGRGMPLQTPKSTIVGHGIDVERFRPSDDYEEHLLLSIGRVTKAKRIEVLLSCVRSLPHCHLRVVGLPITREDRKYDASLRHALLHEGLAGRVVMEPLSHEELQRILPCAHVFLHVSETALDKALLEAMACGVPIVSTNPAAQELLPGECCSTDRTFLENVHSMLALTQQERTRLGQQLRAIVEERHGLSELIQRLVADMS